MTTNRRSMASLLLAMALALLGLNEARASRELPNAA
jgi:hypothetical protein